MRELLIFAFFVPSVFSVRAQIPVSKEPMHHNILDNAHVRLLDVHIPPGDTTQMHIHATPSVFLILSNVKTGSQVIQEENHTASLFSHDGNIWFEGFYRVPRIHRVWNQDTTEFHVMDIELPNNDYIILDPPVKQESFTLLIEEKPVRVYRVSLAPGHKISLPPRKADVLLIQLSEYNTRAHAEEAGMNGQSVDGKYFYKKGDFSYLQKGAPIELENEGSANAEFAFFELR